MPSLGRSRPMPAQGRSVEQRIGHGQAGEAPKIAIHGPELPNPMLPAEGGNARVVDAPAARVARQNLLPELVPVLLRLCQQHQCRRLQPRLYLIERPIGRRRRIVDAWMGDDRQKFMNAGPRNRPCGRAFGKLSKTFRCRSVKRRIFSMRVDENIRVDCDQEPRPS